MLLHVIPASCPVYDDVRLSADVQRHWCVMYRISTTPSYSEDFNAVNLLVAVAVVVAKMTH